MSHLELKLPAGLKTENAGLFISPGHGIHPDRSITSYELIFVRSGRLGLEEEGRFFDLAAGDALLLWPGRRHRGTATYEADLSFYWVHFHPPRGGRGRSLHLPQQMRPGRPERVMELFHRLLDDQEAGAPDADEAALWVTLLLLELQRGESADAARPAHALAGRAERFIAQNFRKGIHAGDVARAMASNPDYLARVYREAHGCTLSEAIHRLQLKEARTLLRESPRNIEEIALACGFREPRYFRKIFTERQGIGPRDYRKLHARAHVNTR
jgi:AraC-like DNA-binding protein